MLFLYALFDEQEKAAEKVKIYVGVDEELDYFGKAEGIAFIRHLLETEGFCYDITLFDVSFIGQLCRMWNELAAKAYRDGQVRCSRLRGGGRMVV